MTHDPHAHADGSRECRPAHDMGPVPGGWPDWSTVTKAILPLVQKELAHERRGLGGAEGVALMRFYAEHTPYVAPVDPIEEAAREAVLFFAPEYDWGIGGTAGNIALRAASAGAEINKAQQPVRDLPDREAAQRVAIAAYFAFRGDARESVREAVDAVLALIANPEAQRS